MSINHPENVTVEETEYEYENVLRKIDITIDAIVNEITDISQNLLPVLSRNKDEKNHESSEEDETSKEPSSKLINDLETRLLILQDVKRRVYHLSSMIEF